MESIDTGSSTEKSNSASNRRKRSLQAPSTIGWKDRRSKTSQPSSTQKALSLISCKVKMVLGLWKTGQLTFLENQTEKKICSASRTLWQSCSTFCLLSLESGFSIQCKPRTRSSQWWLSAACSSRSLTSPSSSCRCSSGSASWINSSSS